MDLMNIALSSLKEFEIKKPKVGPENENIPGQPYPELAVEQIKRLQSVFDKYHFMRNHFNFEICRVCPEYIQKIEHCGLKGLPLSKLNQECPRDIQPIHINLSGGVIWR